MVKTLLQFFLPVSAAIDEETSAIPPRAIGALSLTILLASLLSAIPNMILGDFNIVARLLPLVAGALLCILLLHRAMHRAAGLVLCLCALLTSVLEIGLTRNGILDSAMLLFPGTLIISALILDLTGFVIFCVCLLCCEAGLGIAQLHHLLALQSQITLSVRDIIDQTVILSVTAIAAGFLSFYMRRNFFHIHRQKATIAQAHLELQHQTRQLRISEEKFRQSIALAVDAILQGDPSGVIVDMNERAASLTGYDPQQLIGEPISVLFSETTLAQTPLRFDLLQKGERVIIERLLRRSDNTEVLVEMHSRMMPDSTYQTILHEIGERRKLEEQVQNHQRLESLGLLAGGIAHDFNNLLGGVYGYLGLIRVSLESNEGIASIEPLLVDAEKTIHRARDLSNQLLTFSKGGAPITHPAHLGKLFHDAARFALAGTPVCCTETVEPLLCLCDVDTGQMSQVFSNLLINAVQAMPGGGTVHMRARNSELGADNPGNLPAGPYVVLTICDTGSGIDPKLLTRIFDPFVTTKPTGSGLGLSICYSIITKHHGWITAQNSDTQGACFTLYVPALPGHEVLPVAHDAPAYDIAGCSVLLLDDEPVVLENTAKALRRSGCTVVAASSSDEALSDMQKKLSEKSCFDVAILDLTLRNGLSGTQTLGRLLALDPLLYAIASSGYSHDPVFSNPQDFGFRAILRKPYTITELFDAVASAPRRTLR